MAFQCVANEVSKTPTAASKQFLDNHILMSPLLGRRIILMELCWRWSWINSPLQPRLIVGTLWLDPSDSFEVG